MSERGCAARRDATTGRWLVLLAGARRPPPRPRGGPARPHLLLPRLQRHLLSRCASSPPGSCGRDVVPFWNPYIYEGAFALPTFYPVDLLHVLDSGPAAVSWLLTLHLPLAAVGAYWLARELGADSLAKLRGRVGLRPRWPQPVLPQPLRVPPGPGPGPLPDRRPPARGPRRRAVGSRGQSDPRHRGRHACRGVRGPGPRPRPGPGRRRHSDAGRPHAMRAGRGHGPRPRRGAHRGDPGPARRRRPAVRASPAMSPWPTRSILCAFSRPSCPTFSAPSPTRSRRGGEEPSSRRGCPIS